MNQVLIQFQGFHPTDFTRSYLDGTLSEIQAESPHGATLRAVFKRKRKVFTASVRVMSAAGHFFATAQGEHMREVAHQLTARVRKQLKRLRTIRLHRGRFQNELDPELTEAWLDDPVA